MNFTSQTLRLAFLAMVLNATPTLAATFNKLSDLEVQKRPASAQLSQQLVAAPIYQAKAIDLAKVQKEDALRDSSKQAYRFALPVEAANFNQLGRWHVQGDIAIWRLTVSSEKAKSFSVGIKNLFMPQGAKLFFYSKNYQILLGPYNHKDNKANGQLWTPVIESNNITIEFNVPLAYKDLLSFDIASISQGYRGIRASNLVKSGTCNRDVVCSEGDAWRDQTRSVGRYTITNSGQSFLCTGTLINNIRADLTPYFLTAGHCGVSTATAPSIVVYWNYETSVCGATPDGSLQQFQSGTSFRATSGSADVTGSDFALVQLDNMPDPNFNVYWSGWDRSDVAPSSGVSIHHPSGDEKRISIENDPLLISDYSSNTNTSNSHLQVTNWDIGTTEGGSSGSGIWNADHRLVGTLSGGQASCSNQSSSDWYGRFFQHWNGNGTAESQVKTWLDPDSIASMAIDGRDACSAPIVTIAGVPTSSSIGQPLNFSVSATGGTGPYNYSWDMNQNSKEDVSGSSVSYIYNYLFRGNIKVTATDAIGCKSSDSSAIVVTNNGAELFPQNNVLPTDWMVVSNADAGWEVDGNITDEGNSSATSSTIVDDQTAAVEVTKDFSGNQSFIAFSYKVSSEQHYDRFIFEIDGDVKETWSGEVGWRTSYFQLLAGTHDLKWSYIKDQSVSNGSDRAWIDGLVIEGLGNNNNQAPLAAISAANQTVNERVNVTLDASASSDPNGDTLSYHWMQIAGPTVLLSDVNAVIATFNAPQVDSDIQLSFSVTVTDIYRVTSSAETSVTVKNTPPITSSSGGGGGGGPLDWYLLGLIALGFRFRKKA